MLATLLFAISFVGTANADEDVTPSDTNYTVEINNPPSGVFIYNKKSIGTEVGMEYYMTYTVKSVEHQKDYRQQGVIGSNVPGQTFPYVCYEEGLGGLMKFETKDFLLTPGNTYFLKFTITKDGYDCRASWANKGKSRYIEFSQEYGDIKTGLGHFGLWIGDGELNAELVKVRFYDKKGNDLGVKANLKDAIVYLDDPAPKDTQVQHSYNITVKDRVLMAISNKFTPTSDKVFMEYKVKNSSKVRVEQEGVILSTAPVISYPYLNGVMIYDQYARDINTMTEGPLMTVGAEYLIIFEKKKDALEVTVQKTLNGKTSLVEFAATYGNYNKDAHFYSIWLCGLPDYPYDVELVDFKCYDSNKKNLGVQCNMPAEIVHFGGLEEYEGCEAVYYNEADESYYALYEDQSLVFGKDGKTQKGTYAIDSKYTLTTKIAKTTKNYNYRYMDFEDSEGNTYTRLHTYKMIFETGEGSDVQTQMIGVEDGYMATKPDAPTLKGNSFEGWYTVDGKEYNFDKMVTESITLYAKWAETQYANSNTIDDETIGIQWPYVAGAAGTIILIAAIVSGVIIVVKGKKHADSN